MDKTGPKKYGSIFLLDSKERELFQNKRVLDMMNMAREVHTFKAINETLLCLLKPGEVPELLIAGGFRYSREIRSLMKRFADLPDWVTGYCKVCILLPPFDIDEVAMKSFTRSFIRPCASHFAHLN